MEELGLPLSKLRVIPLPLGRPRERRGVVTKVASEAATAAATAALRPPLVLRRLRPAELLLRVDEQRLQSPTGKASAGRTHSGRVVLRPRTDGPRVRVNVRRSVFFPPPLPLPLPLPLPTSVVLPEPLPLLPLVYFW